MEVILLENIKNLGKIGDIVIVKRGHGSNIKKEFSSLEGNVLVSSINNKKAEVHEV